MNHLKKATKGAVAFIVLCLAVYGAFVLFKRPPDLRVSEGDSAALRDALGIHILSTEVTHGRSPILNTVVAPPIGGSKTSSGRNTSLPAAFGGPVVNSGVPSFDEAPAFAPTEAPMFDTMSAESEPPPFIATAEPPTASAVPSAPLYGNQVQIDVPLPPQSPPTPPKSSPSVQPPAPFLTPPSVLDSPQTQTLPSQQPSVVGLTIPEHTNSHWDSPMASAPELADPWGVTPQTETITFVPPKIKPLPKVEEEPTTEVVVVSPIPTQTGPILQPVTAFPEEYRQASIRKISMVSAADAAPVVSFLPLSPVSKDVPLDPTRSEIVQVAGESTQGRDIGTVPPSLPLVEPVLAAVPNFVEPKTTKANSPPESIPFPVESLLSLEPAVPRAVVTLPKLPREAKPEVGEAILQSVKTEYELIQTNDPNTIRRAYIQLSKLYDQSDLNVFERAYLTPILDCLAVDVVFSRRNHILEAPYIAKIGETAYTLRNGEVLVVPYGNSIDSIAATFNLTSALLMKINGLTNKRPLEPGTELKVVLGQFDAKISTERREFTLILGGLYAGRFPIAIGEDVQNVRGDFTVVMKGETPQGRTLTLSNGITLRGVDHPQPGDTLRSAIRFSERDGTELYDILSERSIVAVGK